MHFSFHLCIKKCKKVQNNAIFLKKSLVISKKSITFVPDFVIAHTRTTESRC